MIKLTIILGILSIVIRYVARTLISNLTPEQIFLKEYPTHIQILCDFWLLETVGFIVSLIVTIICW